MSRSAILITIGVVALVAATPALGEAAIEGHVLQVTADEVFLDRGARDGLRVGAQITLTGDGETRILDIIHVSNRFAAAALNGSAASAGEAWTANVSSAAQTGAISEAQVGVDSRAQAGASSEAQASAEEGLGTASASPAIGPHSAPYTPEVLAAAWTRALSAPFPLRKYQRPENAPYAVAGQRWARVTAAARADAWSGGAPKNYAGGLLRLRGASALSGDDRLHLDLDCDVEGWPSRPDDDRLRPGGDASVLVHSLAVEYAPAGGGIAVLLGRTRPLTPPGLPLLDGAMISWTPHREPQAISPAEYPAGAPHQEGAGRSDAVSPAGAPSPVEVGIYGGYAPSPLDLAPSGQRNSFGAFARAEGLVTRGVTGSAGGRVALIRADGVNQETGQLLVSLAARQGIAFDGSAAAAHPPGVTRLGELAGTLCKRDGPSEVTLAYRNNQAVFDPVQASAVREVLGEPAVTPARTQRAEVGYSRSPAGGSHLRLLLGRSIGSDGFDRWIGEGELSRAARFGPVAGWTVGYRGSSGWQEGHEGELGVRLGISSWRIDLLASGGLVRQDLADRTTPLGRGTASVQRPLGDFGSLDFFLAGQAGGHAVALTSTLGVSWRDPGERE